MDAKEPPRHLRKTLIFPIDFYCFALPDPFGGRSQCALHFQNKQKRIGFITFRMSRLGTTWGTRRSMQNRKVSATLHGSAPAQNETSATLHGNAFGPHGSPKRGAQKMAQTIICQTVFDVFWIPLTEAWLRAGAEPNERHAAWERDFSKHM